MKGLLSIVIFVWLNLALGIACGAEGDEPLTLLEEPGKNPQGQLQQAPQLSAPGQPGQGMSEPMKMYDIYGVIPTRPPLPYGAIALGVLAALLIAALLYWLYKRGKRPVPVPLIPPWDRALAELKEARTLFSQEEGRHYMARASQILRQYVEDRFAIQSTRQTTREFLGSLQHSSAPRIENYKLELQRCLEQADMAKFAHKSQDEESLMVMEQAVSTFVHATRPPENGEEKK